MSNKTWGINNDWWHGIIPAVVLPAVGGFAAPYFLYAFITLFGLHFFNEWTQYNKTTDDDLFRQQINSHNDTVYFAWGMVGGALMAGLFYVLFVY